MIYSLYGREVGISFPQNTLILCQKLLTIIHPHAIISITKLNIVIHS